MTRLLADENVPRRSIARLREAGVDVEGVRPGASDRDVLARLEEGRRILVGE